MERAHRTQTTGRIAGVGPRRGALHLLAEIRVTGRGKQVQFYWAAGEPGELSGRTGPVWRTVQTAALAPPGARGRLAGSSTGERPGQ